jgi:hypothetical protein
LRGAILSGAIVSRDTVFLDANLAGAKLDGVALKDAKLARAQLQGVRLPGADFSGCDLSGAHFGDAWLISANFADSRLYGTHFPNADLEFAIFDGAKLNASNFRDARLGLASFVGATMKRAILTKANLTDANFDRADLDEAKIDNANFARTRGLTTTKHLHTVRGRAKYFETVVVPPLEKYLGWERLRWIGRLPLFAASYSVLVAIPLLYYLLDLYNRNVVLRQWAAKRQAQDATASPIARVILDHLQREAFPSLSRELLLFTLILAVAATIFAARCPPRIREFSQERWVDELERPLQTYWADSWREPWIRVLCALCYAVGGTGVVLILLTKLWRTLVLIVENS